MYYNVIFGYNAVDYSWAGPCPTLVHCNRTQFPQLQAVPYTKLYGKGHPYKKKKIILNVYYLWLPSEHRDK